MFNPDRISTLNTEVTSFELVQDELLEVLCGVKQMRNNYVRVEARRSLAERSGNKEKQNK